jgi:hypothetical protein
MRAEIKGVNIFVGFIPIMLASEFSEIRQPIFGAQQVITGHVGRGAHMKRDEGREAFEKPHRIAHAYGNGARSVLRILGDAGAERA